MCNPLQGLIVGRCSRFLVDAGAVCVDDHCIFWYMGVSLPCMFLANSLFAVTLTLIRDCRQGERMRFRGFDSGDHERELVKYVSENRSMSNNSCPGSESIHEPALDGVVSGERLRASS